MDGSIDPGNQSGGITAEHTSTGVWTVTFPRSWLGCTAVANPVVNPGENQWTTAALVFDGGSNTVIVWSQPDAEDFRFDIALFC
jgi:hypothetical protein